jgi:hypothetical protein
MKAVTLPKIDVSHLDSFFLNTDGTLKAVDDLALHQLDSTERRVWAHNNSVYQFVSKEMIAWLKGFIGGRTAIEICAGNGAIGRHLGIPATDNGYYLTAKGIGYCQSRGERPVRPAEDVINMEAIEAVEFERPRVVIGAFVPPQYKHMYGTSSSGVSWGVDEEQLLRTVETYILLGNVESHMDRRIFRNPHKEYTPPWQVTRCENQSLNRMWIWDKRDFKHY